MKENQCSQILRYIKEHGSITARQADRDLGCMRLASRIGDLRSMGVSIRTRTVCGMNRNGKKTYYAEYYIEEEV